MNLISAGCSVLYICMRMCTHANILALLLRTELDILGNSMLLHFFPNGKKIACRLSSREEVGLWGRQTHSLPTISLHNSSNHCFPVFYGGAGEKIPFSPGIKAE